ncbi:MAG TPA: BtpA/SgcQ family protein [Firmicutes bacterium]|nr:BtpA/SgcQ family protein [Bacillota bacterium]
MKTILRNLSNKKLLIGMVHLLPMPGSPDFTSMDTVIKQALADAKILERAGFHAVMIENFGDTPFYKTHVPPETISAFTLIASKIKEYVKIPVGINVLRNDGFAAVAIANAVGGMFIRINVFISAVLTDQGIIEGQAAELIRYRNQLNPNIAVFADVSVKHSYPLSGKKIELFQEIKEAFYRGKADGIIISGKETGSGPDLKELRKVRENLKEIPLLVGSGTNLKNAVEYKKYFDGFIIGTAIKKGNVTSNPVDSKKAEEIVKVLSK